MNELNDSIQEFIIIGFPGYQDRNSRFIIFGVLLTVYAILLLGNLFIIVIVLIDRDLHTPMYILMSNLALVDVVITTTTIPKLLAVLGTGASGISIAGCFIQTLFCGSVTAVESFLLAIMAYDRYLAICKPLHYYTITNNSVVFKQVVCCWVGGFIALTIPLSLTFRLQFCGSNKLLHFFCDHSALLKLACTDTTINSYLSLSIGMCVLLGSMLYILFSYAKIIMSVLKVTGNEGGLKAFSTCGTHLLVISVFFLVAAGVYTAGRVPGSSLDIRVIAALIQNVTPPLMNPVIYCLRTKEIKVSFVRLLKRIDILPNGN
ncbi:olfactory receptor 6N1-like [Erpetoichthys calabaricus]|uniref:olfactory receptor 6N1-like n=1 Tax=Erpetoichthys calabaricus TaxID=27687 RepID=UPI00109F3E64|nr:olfactory receptor 6N1-like [Erpetoichthys calabaricus]